MASSASADLRHEWRYIKCTFTLHYITLHYIIRLTFGDFERSDQGHLLKNRVSVQDSTEVTIKQ